MCMPISGVGGISSASYFSSMLLRGARGPEVSALQQQLADAGFDPGPLDGDFGPMTEAAVRAFQESHGCEVDGVVGPRRAERSAAQRRLPRLLLLFPLWSLAPSRRCSRARAAPPSKSCNARSPAPASTRAPSTATSAR